MTESEFRLGLKFLLKAGLANAPVFDEDVINIWFLYFSEVSEKEFLSAAVIYISNNSFFPTVNSLLSLIKPKDEFLSKYQIWEEFKIKGKKDLDPLITKAFRIAGIDRSYLKDVTTDTAQRILRPRVEKIYEGLISKQNQVIEQKVINKIVDAFLLEGEKKYEEIS